MADSNAAPTPGVPPQRPAPGKVDKAGPGDKSPTFLVAEKVLGHYRNGDRATESRLRALGVDDDRLAQLVAGGHIIAE